LNHFRRCLVLVLIVCSVNVSSLAWGFECTRNKKNCFVNLHWANRTIPYVVRVPKDSPIPQSELIEAVNAAAAVWNNIKCSDIQLVYLGVVTSDEVAKVKNEITLVTEVWLGRSENHRDYQVGLARVRSDSSSGVIESATIELNAEYFDLSDGSRRCLQASEKDLQSVMVHEFGHFLGIAHPCEYDDRGINTELFSEDNFSLNSCTVVGSSMGTSNTEEITPSCPVIACEDLLLSQPETQSLGDRPTMWPDIFGSCGEVVSTKTEILLLTPQRTLEADDSMALCFIYPSKEATQMCEHLPDGSIFIGNDAFACSSVMISTKDVPYWTFLMLLLLVGVRRIRPNNRQFAIPK